MNTMRLKVLMQLDHDALLVHISHDLGHMFARVALATRGCQPHLRLALLRLSKLWLTGGAFLVRLERRWNRLKWLLLESEARHSKI